MADERTQRLNRRPDRVRAARRAEERQGVSYPLAIRYPRRGQSLITYWLQWAFGSRMPGDGPHIDIGWTVEDAGSWSWLAGLRTERTPDGGIRTYGKAAIHCEPHPWLAALVRAEQQRHEFATAAEPIKAGDIVVLRPDGQVGAAQAGDVPYGFAVAVAKTPDADGTIRVTLGKRGLFEL